MYSTVMMLSQRNFEAPEIIDDGQVCALLLDKVKAGHLYTAIYVLYYKERVKSIFEEFVIDPQLEVAFLAMLVRMSRAHADPMCGEGRFDVALSALGVELPETTRVCRMGDIFLVFRVPLKIKKEELIRRISQMSSQATRPQRRAPPQSYRTSLSEARRP